MRNRKLATAEAARWEHRGDVLDTVNKLLRDKPDREEWDDREWRSYHYALAISRRMDKLN